MYVLDILETHYYLQVVGNVEFRKTCSIVRLEPVMTTNDIPGLMAVVSDIKESGWFTAMTRILIHWA